VMKPRTLRNERNVTQFTEKRVRFSRRQQCMLISLTTPLLRSED
jgi:hypothetical protein